MRVASLFVIVGCITGLTVVAQSKSNEVLETSPSGAFRIEQTGEDFSVVSTADDAQRSRLRSAELAIPERFDFSPNEEWLFVELHRGSCLSGADLYRRNTNTNIFERTPDAPLDAEVWQQATRDKLFPRNFAEEGFCAMTRFAGWSADSGRLLLRVIGGEERRDTRVRYLYYNTRQGRFELTPYLRKLNGTKSPALPCPEPLDPLPDAAALQQQLEHCDARLNDTYREMLATADNETAQELRQSQRDWLKAREAGLRLYLAAFPASEKEQRRLQYLADTTRARVALGLSEADD